MPSDLPEHAWRAEEVEASGRLRGLRLFRGGRVYSGLQLADSDGRGEAASARAAAAFALDLAAGILHENADAPPEPAEVASLLNAVAGVASRLAERVLMASADPPLSCTQAQN